jgi:hypothetical protein
LHISAIAADGELLGEVVSTYRSLSPKTGTLDFSQRLAVPVAQLNRVRVTHHSTDHGSSGTAAGPSSPTELASGPAGKPA